MNFLLKSGIYILFDWLRPEGGEAWLPEGWMFSADGVAQHLEVACMMFGFRWEASHPVCHALDGEWQSCLCYTVHLALHYLPMVMRVGGFASQAELCTDLTLALWTGWLWQVGSIWPIGCRLPLHSCCGVLSSIYFIICWHNPSLGLWTSN